MGFSRQESWRGLPFPSEGDANPRRRPAYKAASAFSNLTWLWNKSEIIPALKKRPSRLGAMLQTHDYGKADLKHKCPVRSFPHIFQSEVPQGSEERVGGGGLMWMQKGLHWLRHLPPSSAGRVGSASCRNKEPHSGESHHAPTQIHCQAVNTATEKSSGGKPPRPLGSPPINLWRTLQNADCHLKQGTREGDAIQNKPYISGTWKRRVASRRKRPRLSSRQRFLFSIRLKCADVI